MKLLELFIDVSVRGNRAINSLKRVEGQASKTEASLGRVGSGAAALVGKFAAITAGAYSLTKGIGFVVNSGAEIQEGMVGISKTTGIAGSELDDLRTKLARLARDPSVNATTAQLFELAQTAGTMGLTASKDILLFTETLAKLNGASGGKLGGERAGQLLSAILAASGEGIKNLDDLASTFVELGNTFRVNEGQIAGVADRVFKSLARFDVSSAEVVGLSAAFAELQITPELAGSSVARVLGQLEKSLGQGGKSLRAFEKATGRSRAELSAMFKKDTVGAFLAVAEGLKEMQLEGENLPTLMQDMGLSSIQIAQVLPLLGHDMDRVRQIIGSANDAFKDNTALTNEAAAAGQTFSAKMQAMRNSFKFLGDAIARSGVLDMLTRIVDKLTSAVAAITDWVNQNPQLVNAIAKATEAIGPWIAALLGIVATLGIVRASMGAFFRFTLFAMGGWVTKMVAKVALLSAELLGLTKLFQRVTGKTVGDQGRGRQTGGRGGQRGPRSTAPKASAAPKVPAWALGLLGRIAGPASMAYAIHGAEQAEAEFQRMSATEKAAVINAGRKQRQELNNWIADTFLFGFGKEEGDAPTITPQQIAEIDARGEKLSRRGAVAHSMTDAPNGRGAYNNMAPLAPITHTETTTNNVSVAVTVNAETNADPHVIADIAGSEIERRIQGAMLEANN